MVETEIKKPKRNYPAILVVGSILALVLITFALQNAELVQLRFFKLSGEVTKSLLIFICIFGGTIVGVLFSLPAILKHRKNAKILAKELKAKKEEFDAIAKPAIENIKNEKPVTKK